MRILARISCASLLALCGLALAPSSAQGALGGVTLNAVGVGFQWTFDQPGSPIPAKPTGEMEQAYSLAEYSSGPSAHGLSSLWWPGSAGANFGPSLCPEYCPAYPVRAEAFSPGKPHKDENAYGPNTTMQAAASPKLASAETHSQNFGQAQPAFVTGDFASSGATTLSGDVAVSEGTAQASDVTIAGVVHIDSVITTAKAVTNGKNGTVSGETEVSGASVNGQAVTIDEKGVHAGGQTVPVFDPINNQQVQQALDQAGITMKVAKPVDDLKGAQAQRSLGGLVVTFESGALNAILDQLPKEIRDQLQKYIAFNQTMTMNFGAVTVGSETVGGVTFQPPTQPPGPPPGAPGTGGASGGGGSFGGGPGGGGFGPGGRLPGSNGGSGGNVASAPAALPINIPPIHGIPAMLTALSIVAAVGSSRILKHVADKALAARAADRCPLEDG